MARGPRRDFVLIHRVTRLCRSDRTITDSPRVLLSLVERFLSLLLAVYTERCKAESHDVGTLNTKSYFFSELFLSVQKESKNVTLTHLQSFSYCFLCSSRGSFVRMKTGGDQPPLRGNETSLHSLDGDPCSE